MSRKTTGLIASSDAKRSIGPSRFQVAPATPLSQAWRRRFVTPFDGMESDLRNQRG